MISQIAEAISAFFYSMDVIDEEEKGKSRYGIEIIISTIIGFSVIIISGKILIDLMERFIGRVNDYLLYSAYYR